MPPHSPIDRALREREARRIYAALFGGQIPPLLLARFLQASQQIDASAGPAALSDHYTAVENCPDLEALELAARLTGRLPLLPRKFQAMAYLAETLPDHQDHFINRRSSLALGLFNIVWGGLRSLIKGMRGAWLLLAAERRHG